MNDNDLQEARNSLENAIAEKVAEEVWLQKVCWTHNASGNAKAFGKANSRLERVYRELDTLRAQDAVSYQGEVDALAAFAEHDAPADNEPDPEVIYEDWGVLDSLAERAADKAQDEMTRRAATQDFMNTTDCVHGVSLTVDCCCCDDKHSQPLASGRGWTVANV